MPDRARPLSAGELAALAALVVLAVLCTRPYMAQAVSFDGLHSYLPMARRLLGEGLAYFGREESLAYAPLAYVWPALLGAHEAAVRWANVALYGGTIVLAFFTLRSTHSTRAAFIAAFLLAVSPTIAPFVADVLTEPPFIFLAAVWIASIAAVVRGHRVAGIVAGGIALTLASLTRPAVMYFPLLAGAVFAWRAWRGSGDERRIDASLALLHAVGLAGCAAYIVRNALVFGFPSVATGAGAALFFGINPLVDGFDPNYYGLAYDEGAVTHAESHLTLEADRLLRRVALRELQDIPLPVLLEMAVRKTFAFVFVTANLVGSDNVAVLRAWRVLLVVFALAAVVAERRSRIVIALAALAAYMLAVHVPLLYHHRYSVGALDLPLSLLAGIGIASSLARPARFAALCVAAVLGAAIGLAMMANAGPGSPHPDRSHHEVIWSREKAASAHVPRDGGVEVRVAPAPGFDPYHHFMLTTELALKPAAHGTCRGLRIRYRDLGEPGYVASRLVRVPVDADGMPHELRVGMAGAILVRREGVMRLEPECDSDSDLTVRWMRVLKPDRADYYRARVLGSN